MTPSQLGVVIFRWRDPALSSADIDVITHATADRMRQDGYALVLSTSLNRRPVLRVCPINPSTTIAELEKAVSRLGRFALASYPRSDGA